MSRIDEALRRITGAAAETPTGSLLKRFTVEKAPTHDEDHLSAFVQATPPFLAETKTALPPKVSAPHKTAATAPLKATTPEIESIPSAAPAAFQDPAETYVEAEPHSEDEKFVDVRLYADYAGFLIGSLRRHKILALGTFGFALALTAAAVVLLPRTYHVGVKLLAQRNEVIAALSNPGRAVPWDADAPTRAAAETVLRRENLIGLVKETDLLQDWERTRAPLLKFKDLLIRFATQHTPTPDEKLDSLLGLLEARMIVLAGPSGDGTVSIDIDWPNAQTAFHLVEAAQQAFLDARQRAETAAITESITILERYSSTLHEDINRTLAQLQHTQSRPLSAGGGSGVTRVTAHLPAVQSITSLLPPVPSAALENPELGGNLDDPEIPRLKAGLTAKRQEISGLEETRKRQLAELQSKLVQLTTIYTPSHPAVQSVQQNVTALSRDSPQLLTLKAELKNLDTEYQKRVAAVAEIEQEEQLKAEFAAASAQPEKMAPAPVRRLPAPAAAQTNTATATAAASNTDFAAVRLRLQLNQLESVLERTDGARIEMAVSQAAFKYRYTVIRPAQVPRGPVRPNLPLVAIVGFILSLMLAFAIVLGTDLGGNRILEQWQIERQLGLPVLATLGSV